MGISRRSLIAGLAATFALGGCNSQVRQFYDTSHPSTPCEHDFINRTKELYNGLNADQELGWFTQSLASNIKTVRDAKSFLHNVLMYHRNIPRVYKEEAQRLNNKVIVMEGHRFKGPAQYIICKDR